MVAKDIASTSVEATLIRKLGKARRISSAQERLTRLQREIPVPPGGMIRLPAKPKKKASHAPA
jgi:hypothetical protein